MLNFFLVLVVSKKKLILCKYHVTLSILRIILPINTSDMYQMIFLLNIMTCIIDKKMTGKTYEINFLSVKNLLISKIFITTIYYYVYIMGVFYREIIQYIL